MQFLIASGDILDCRNYRLQLLLRFFELLMKFYDLFERGDLLLRLARLVEPFD